jgi:DNA-binding helix-hairpin-helix protein with protein kinase domain
MEYYLWGNGTRAINQTAVTVIVDVSLNVTRTSTRTDTQMIQDHYYSTYIADCPRCTDEHASVVIGDEEILSLSKSGTVL